MAEIIIKDDETPAEVARRLLDQAEHPDHVVWTPRSNTPHGGVFTVPDDEVDNLVARVEARRTAEAEATKARLEAAAVRDERADATGLTPEELGFPASVAEDLGSGPAADDEDEEDGAEDDGDEADEGGPAKVAEEPTEEPTEEPQESRAAARRRAAREKKAAEAEQGDGKTETE